MRMVMVFGVAAAAALPIAAFAKINLNLDYPAFGPFDLNENQSLPEIIGFFYYFIVIIAGLAAFVMLVWGGVQWLVSGAAPAQASEARDRIKNAVLGLLLVLASFLVVQILNPELTVIRSDVLDPITREAPPYEGYEGSVGGSAPPGWSKQGVYLCDTENCAGGEFLLFKVSASGCDRVNDLSDVDALRTSPCIEHSDQDFPDWTDWDKRVKAVRMNEVVRVGRYDDSAWALFLFEGVDHGGRTICFRGGAMDRLSAFRLDLQPIKRGWDGRAKSLLLNPRADLTCPTHGVTLLDINDVGWPPQSIVLFNEVNYGKITSQDPKKQLTFELPIERWGREKTSTGDRTDQYGEARTGGFLGGPPRVKSILIADTPSCAPSLSDESEPCAVRLWADDDFQTNPNRANICFTSSQQDLTKYSFEYNPEDFTRNCVSAENDLTDDIKGLEVITASECPVEGKVFSCNQ